MKTTILVSLLVATLASPATALSIKDFNAKPPAEQASYVTTFIERMSADLGGARPGFTDEIRRYFYSKKPDGTVTSEGLDKLTMELLDLEMRARDGKADLSKIEIESVIVWVVKQKFPPEQQ